MKIFIDTANVEEIRKAAAYGILDGVTTNPSLIAKEGRDLKEVIEEICSIVDGPISAEVMSLESEGMISEGRELSKLHKNITVKIPMCEEGLKAVNVLSKEGIKTNVTLIFSAQQALLAAKAGATFVSPFVGRLDDIGNGGMQIIEDIADVFSIYGIETEIIAASIRTPMHTLECAKVGADIATIPYKVIAQMIKHPLTDMGIAKFIEDYNKSQK
ncbi:transaldolase [Clostridium collagenovorans DSM 3089]|uniref:Probable transaldolase n=1 Tax=Clostridium collagenovorans DSM 3089 TaxID=1121306 RepID=A0A1M5WKM9_9CLOT|nr:fructose-6-phosphate aldolase [Clostridium collagenovorans]SHH88031.1 transaldolase [Clostridium collagenovorans DSM 3089]